MYIPKETSYNKDAAFRDLIEILNQFLSPISIKEAEREIELSIQSGDPLRVRERLPNYIPNLSKIEIKKRLTNKDLRLLDKLLFFYP
ncbi:hypothetical protein D1Z90_20380 [Motilimonas pumila]|uniref:Uncharacterized protein n=1 Tax=Motilimonas pumila TaxID=2303987 RepID=A0A418Y966_9GAMM|nr:hypothetical protein D1Z90_20380 [Motilimonas pumila]